MAIDTTGAITPDKLKPVELLKTLTEPTPDLGGLLGTTESVAGQFQAISDEQKRQEELNKNAETDITNAMQVLTSKEADIQTAMKDTGATAASESITGINAQAQALFKEAQAIPIQIQQQFAGAGATAGGVAPIQASRLRENALKALSLSQQYDIAKGNYDVAKQKADQMIAVKYKPLEDALALKQQQYLFNKDALERIDKKRTEALGIYLKQKETEMQNEKDMEKRDYEQKIQTQKDTNSIALEAAKGGAPQSVIQAIKTATDVNQAIEYASGFLDSALELQLKQMAQTQANADRTFNESVRSNKASESVAWYNATKKPASDGLPSSYKEWELAGGLAGSGKTYAQWANPDKATVGTQAQQTVAEYAARIEQAEPTINSLEKTIQGMNIANFKVQLSLPSSLQSTEMQQYMQAGSNFINAKLRKESGAVIATSEFDEARRQYLPQPGDSDETLKLKKNNRGLVYGSLKKAAGPAFSSVNELLGNQNNQVIEYQGKRYKVDSNGDMTPL